MSNMQVACRLFIDLVCDMGKDVYKVSKSDLSTWKDIYGDFDVNEVQYLLKEMDKISMTSVKSNI